MKSVLLLLLLIPAVALGFELKLKKNGTYIDAAIFNVELPTEKLNRDIKSGLPTVFVATLTIWNKKKLVNKIIQKFDVYYDLWDEVFYLRTEDADSKAKKFMSSSEIVSALQHNYFLKIIKATDLVADHMSVRFALVMDPISKEKKIKIKKWMALNQVSLPSPTPSGGTEGLIEAPAPSTKDRSFFNKILDSELNDEIESGEWSYLSPEQKISKDMVHEK